MVRPLAALALVLGVVAGGGTARATETTRVMGMYTGPSGGAAAAQTPLPMLESKIEVTVRGPIVETVVTQRFANRADHAIEATYIFPLPYDAAVSAMAIRTGTRTIRAAIEKREEAQRRYEAAITAGVPAAVLDQERPDVFTQTVAAIPAKGTVEIVLRYDSLARYADGTWQLVLPMVVAPRYVPGTVSGRPTVGTGRAPDTDRAPDASRVTPGTGPQQGGPTRVAIHFAEPVTDVTSTTHELGDAQGPDIAFADPYSDHDAVVQWKAKVPAAGWVEGDARGGYAAVIVEAPPAPARKGAARLTLVLDRAATMRGDANVAAQPLVRALLGALAPADRVAVIGGDTVPWSPPADALRAVELAWQRPHSPFDLTRVLATAKPEGAPLVLVSDGLVADDPAALAAAKKLGVPIHVIGVGPAPARGLLTQIAAITGGTVRFVLPPDDLNGIAKAAVQDITSPPAPLTVNWGSLAASDVVPGILPRLGAGQAMLVLARVKRAQSANARARGELFAIETLGSATATVQGATSSAGPLARRWARLRLDELLAGAPDEARVTQHALSFGLVSPYTSLVAVGTDVVVEGGTKRSVAVPVSVPSGMHWNDVKRETQLDFDTEAPTLEKPESTSLNSRDKGTGKDDKDDKNAKAGTKTQKDRPAKKAPQGNTGVAVGGAPVPQQPAPAAPPPPPAPDAKSKYYRDELGGEDSDEDGVKDGEAEDDDAAKSKKKSVARADEETVETTGMAGETISLRDVSPMSAYSAGRRHRRFRAVVALGGGLVVQGQDPRAAISTNLRLEVGLGRSAFGAEGSLWLVDGLHAQGNALVSFSRFGIVPYLELGLGAGLHVGDGVGPAWSLSLRFHLPPAPWASAYLRYDGAYLREDDADAQPQNTGTAGFEVGF